MRNPDIAIYYTHQIGIIDARLASGEKTKKKHTIGETTLPVQVPITSRQRERLIMTRERLEAASRPEMVVYRALHTRSRPQRAKRAARRG